jgi:hypothetical protein
MAEIIREYGAAALAAVGGVLFLGTVGQLLLSGQGILLQLVSIWGNGGC